MFQSVTSGVYFVFILILSVSGTFGNVCALLAVAKSPVLRKRNNIFMVSMTFADFLVTAVIEPLMLVQFYYEAWPYSYASCKFFAYLFNYSMGNGTITVSLLTLQRYFKITQPPDKYDKMFGKYKLEIHLVSIWIGGICLGGYSWDWIWQHIFQPAHHDVFLGSVWLWFMASPDHLDGRGHSCSCYRYLTSTYHIFRTVRNARLKVKDHSRNLSGTVQPVSNSSFSKEELRLTKIALVVTLLVVLTWIPTCISYFMVTSVPSVISFFRHSQTIVLINSSLNPYLYAFMNKYYRSAFRDLLAICIKKNDEVVVPNNSITTSKSHTDKKEIGLTPTDE